MAFSNFSIRPTSSTLTASGSGLNFNAPALPNLEALFNRFSPQNDDWKLKYQADLAAYDKNYRPPKDEHQRMMEKLQEREALGKLQAMEQGPVKRMTTFGGGAINGWVTDPNNMNAWQRQMYLPGSAAGGDVGISRASLSPELPQPPTESETPLNSRRLNDRANMAYQAAMAPPATRLSAAEQLLELLRSSGRA